MGQLQADAAEDRSEPLQLLVRPSCMLCLEAEHVLLLAGIDRFERIDIERDATTESLYGARIPVLRRPGDGRELDWPFTPEAARSLA
jgi:hypothetical protein